MDWRGLMQSNNICFRTFPEILPLVRKKPTCCFHLSIKPLTMNTRTWFAIYFDPAGCPKCSIPFMQSLWVVPFNSSFSTISSKDIAHNFLITVTYSNFILTTSYLLLNPGLMFIWCHIGFKCSYVLQLEQASYQFIARCTRMILSHCCIYYLAHSSA